MIDYELDSTGDIYFENFNVVMASDADQLAQRVSIRLKTIKGEWFADPKAGIDYYEDVLGKNKNNVAISNIFKAEILNTPEITAITQFDILQDTSTRQIKITFIAMSIYGEISGSA